MCVVPIAKFLEMTDAFPHQTLRDENVAVKFDSAEDAVFVSHQWCSKDHADPEFRQLSVLQGMFRHAVSGTLRVEVDLFSKVIYKKPSVLRSVDLRGLSRWFMWYDYFSVPQPEASEFAARERVSGELAQAVASLASYVTDCKLFIILAPFVKSVDQTRTLDYVTWKERGWCRFETLSSALSPKERRIVCLASWSGCFPLDSHALGAVNLVAGRPPRFWFFFCIGQQSAMLPRNLITPFPRPHSGVMPISAHHAGGTDFCRNPIMGHWPLHDRVWREVAPRGTVRMFPTMAVAGILARCGVRLQGGIEPAHRGG